ncbi:glycoprotein [Munguba virus]|uniref:Envelopment polyprotein n=1 Tax=Munguba virus TaxID=1048854 RepID=I1T341_9VIRU|nr:glycoprotein [Munguba virus]AEL29658.1 glycoprotein [Munguba virus]
MFVGIFILLVTIVTESESLYKIQTSSERGKTEICLSNDVPTETLAYYWGLSVDESLRLDCSIGSPDNYKATSTKEIKNMIRLVQDSVSKLKFSCKNDDMGFTSSMAFDGLANTDSGTLIVSCKDGSTSGFVRVIGAPENKAVITALESDKRDEGAAERISELMQQIDSLRGELKNTLSNQDGLRESEQRAVKELEDLKEELKMKENLKSEDLAEYTKKIESQEALISKLEREISDLKKVRGDLRALSQKHKDSLQGRVESESRILDTSKKEREVLVSEMRILQEQKKAIEMELERARADSGRHQKASESLKERITQLEEDLKIETNGRNLKSLSQREDWGQSKERVASSSAYSTSTILPIITSVLLLASAVSAEFNQWEHAYNRPGEKRNYKLDSSDDASCQNIDYGSACAGFKYLLNQTQFPLFNSHIHKYNFLEAVDNQIISKDTSGICTLNNGAGVQKCVEYKAHIKSYCPQGFRGAHYIDNSGKLRGVMCPDQHELSDDCNFCLKITGSNVKKSSISLQDGFCQKGGEQLRGKEPVSKVYCRIGRKTIRQCSKFQTHFESVPFVIFDAGNKIYLDNLIMKNDEVLNDSAFLCYDYKGQLAGTNSAASSERAKASVKISECKTVDPSKTRICTGDAVFCTRHSCINEYPNAFCSVAPGSGPVRVYINGAWQTPKCVGFEVVKVLKEVKPPIQTSTQACAECLVDCLSGGISVKTTGKLISTATACSHGYCTSMTQEPSPDAIIPYPGGSHVVGGDISIHISNSAQEPGMNVKTHCPAHDGCSVIDCFFCYENLLNFHCHTIASSLILSVTVVGALSICFFILWKVLIALRIIPKYAKNPIMWIIKLLVWLLRRFQSYAIRKLNWINENINNDVEAQVAAPLGRIDLRPIPRNVLKSAMILSLLACATACSQNQIASSKITRCRAEGGKTICKYTGLINLKAGIIGSESCVVLKGNTDGQQSIIRIKTVSSQSLCREGSSFWTGQFSPICHSSRRCRLVGECKGDNCQSWNSSVTSKEFRSIINPEVMSENRCFEQCGGIGCSCFNVYPSCLFVRAEFRQVRKEAVKVFRCADWSHKIGFEIRSPGGAVEKIELGSMESKFFPWGSISLNLDADSETAHIPVTFLRSTNGGFALIDEVFPEQARKGFIGEIRCSSESAVASAHKSCLRAPDLIHYSPRMDVADCTTSLVDPFAAFLRGALPQSRNGKTYVSSIDKQTVQALSYSVVKADFVLNLDDFEVEFPEAQATCEVAFVNLTGCYSCNSGALACFSVQSSSETDVVLTSKEGGMMFGFSASTLRSVKCQIQHFDAPVIDSMLEYNCGGVSKTIRMKGHLVAQRMRSDLIKTGTSIIVNPVDTGMSVWGIFSGFTSWIGGPLKALGTTAAYVIISIIIILTMIAVIKRLFSAIISGILRKKTS